MIKYELKTTNGIVTQSFFEVCEHCSEHVRELDVVDVVVKKKDDFRILKIRKSKTPDEEILLKNMEEKLLEVTESFIRKGLLDTDEAEEAFINAKERGSGMKYGARAEAMCSESIDTISGVTQSFCYRVAANPNEERFSKIVGGKTLSASFAEASKADITGSKMGVDRKGNVIKLKQYKNIDLETDIPEADSLIKKEGAYKADWWDAVYDARKEDYIRKMQTREAFQERYGADASKDLTVVERFRSEAELRAALSDSRCE